MQRYEKLAITIHLLRKRVTGFNLQNHNLRPMNNIQNLIIL